MPPDLRQNLVQEGKMLQRSFLSQLTDWKMDGLDKIFNIKFTKIDYCDYKRVSRLRNA